MKDNENNYVSFRRDFETGELSPDAKILVAWYKSLDSNRGNQLERSALRHCTDVYEIATNPLFVKLRRELKDVDKDRKISTVRLATVVGVLVHVTQNNNEGFGYQMGKPKKGSSISPVSKLRFQRLLRVQDYDLAHDDDWNRLMDIMIEMLKKLDGNVNIIDIADTIYWWGGYKKSMLARGYYENAPV